MSTPAAPQTVPTIAIKDCGPAVPGSLLRLLVAAVSAAITAVLAAVGAPLAVQAVAGLLGGASVISPSSAAPAALGGGAALVYTVYHSGGPLAPAVLALVVLVHLLHVSAGLAAVVPHRAKLHLSVLRRPLRRFLAIQAAVFTLAGVAAVAPAGRNSVLLEVLAVLGVAAIAVLAIIQLRRR
jgi:hypothetical protein